MTKNDYSVTMLCMDTNPNPRQINRETLGLTQTEAARRAGVSLATWRRWEEDPDRVRLITRVACSSVLERASAQQLALAQGDADFERAWRDSYMLTPRQASAIAMALNWWADTEIADWLKDPDTPLHEVAPFDQLDLRVMMLVGENRAWAAAARERCRAVAKELEQGTTPFDDRRSCFFDELLMALAVSAAQDHLSDSPELFEHLSPREGTLEDDEDGMHGDDDWDMVMANFDDDSSDLLWQSPIGQEGGAAVSILLADRPPSTWFDRKEDASETRNA